LLQSGAAKAIFICLILFNIIIPSVLILLMRATKYIDSMLLENRQERTLPYILITLSYMFGWYQLSRYSIPGNIIPYFFGSMLVVAACGLINFATKISSHAAGIGALCGLIIQAALFSAGEVDLRWYLVGVLLCAGLVFTARLSLKAHTGGQLWIGYTIGLLAMVGGLSVASI
jgi:hypothetical protein